MNTLMIVATEKRSTLGSNTVARDFALYNLNIFAAM
jgi:hypothetical protein